MCNCKVLELIQRAICKYGKIWGNNKELHKYKDQMRKFIIFYCRLNQAFVDGDPETEPP